MTMNIEPNKLQTIINAIPGNFSIYRYVAGRLDVLHFSDAKAALSEYSNDEYNQVLKGDAFNIVMDEDRDLVLNKINKTITCESDNECVYRIKHRIYGYVWIHATFRLLGYMDNEPILLGEFLDYNNQTDPHTELLDNLSSIIYVVEKGTYKMIYANQIALASWGRSNADYATHTCYNYIRGLKKPCPWCSLPLMNDGKFHNQEVYDPQYKRYYTIDCQDTYWYGREAIVIYANDITESKNLQLNLESDKANLKDFIKNIPSGLAVFKYQHGLITLVDANPAFINLLGLDKKRTNIKIIEIVEHFVKYDANRFNQLLKDIYSDKHCGNAVIRFIDDKSGIRWGYLDGVSIFDDEVHQIAYISLTDITAQKQAENRQKQNRELYEKAADMADLSIWEYDALSHHIILRTTHASEMSDSLVTINGSISTIAERFFDTNEQKKFIEIFKKIDNGSKYNECEIWYQRIGGEERHCELLSFNTQFDENNVAIKAFGIGYDITNRKRIEERYFNELAYIKSGNQINVISKGHFSLSNNSTIEFFTNERAFGKIKKGTSYDNAITIIADLIDDDYEKKQFITNFSIDKLKKLMAEATYEYQFKYRQRIPQKSSIWVSSEVKLFSVSANDGIECFIYTYDITDQVLENGVIKQMNLLGFDVFGLINTNNGMFKYYGEKDLDGNKVDGSINQYQDIYIKAVRSNIDLINSENYEELMSLEQVIKQLITNTVYELNYDRYDSNHFIRRKRMQYCFLGKSREYILMCRSDVTMQYQHDRIQMQQLKAAMNEAKQASNAKSSFLSGISHDMRTPLNGIIGFTDLAIEADDDNQRLAYLKKIKTSGNLLLSLINDTLELSKIENNKIVISESVFNFKEMIHSIITASTSNAQLKNITIINDVDESFPQYVLADKIKIQKIILNLLSNAIKFTPLGGSVRLKIRLLKGSKYNTRIIIQDTGKGMTPDFIPLAFEPFTQERSTTGNENIGTGLGLSIVKKIVEMLDGTISVDSKSGIGTIFTINMNIKPSSSNDESEINPQLLPIDVLERKRILLCEDNQINVEIAKAFLQQHNIEVEVVYNRQQGVDIFKSNPANYYQAILMDIRMPVMNGYEATKLIRALNQSDAKTIPIIAMSADAYEEDVQKCLECGMNAHVAKPINQEILIKTLTKYIK